MASADNVCMSIQLETPPTASNPITIHRADQVGSFLRPPELLAARADSTISPEQLRDIEDRCILECLDEQRHHGVTVFTDGELRRATFMSDFNNAVDGISDGDAVQRRWSGSIVAKLGVATGRVRARRRMTKHETDFLKAHSPGDIKMTLPSANQFPAIAYKKGITDKVYSNFSELLWDCAPIIAAEVRALADEGIPYIQIDAPRYSYFIDPKWRQYVHDEMAMNPEDALADAIKVDNAAFAGVTGRPGVFTCIHLCRGNNRSQWYAEGGYDPIAETLFNELDVDAFSLEYETERSGSFAPLRFVPKGKIAILGLVSSKVDELESADVIVRRIEEAAKYVPIEQLAVSPQCGFASMAEGNLITPDTQWRKMELVAAVARRVWGTA
jgi:5-methyltetrahydropteroyltriglutamate--homocysteine methyltransferase